MTQLADDLYTRLNRGPAVLLLGQDHLRLESGEDPFLRDVLTKYGPPGELPMEYGLILRSRASESIDESVAWMHERSERLSIPQWLKTVGSFPWNSLYTSAIDTVWYRAFRSEWRELYPIFESKYQPIDIRSRTILHCTFLFGCVNRSEANERPPLTRREWLKRKQEATVMARRLPEVVTPFGTLVIEGYGHNHDWFAIENLLPLLDALNPGQVHIFSAATGLAEDPDFAELVDTKKLVIHYEGLASFLLQGEQSGRMRLGLRPEEKGLGRQIELTDRVLTVPPEIWNQVSRSAMILDDSILEPPRPVSAEREYYDFVNFLAESSIRPVWSAYPREFAFRRDFESKLSEKIARRLHSRELQREPIIVHGQSGTGKTVALGALAYDVRRERRYPVLFLERRTQRPAYADLDTFCKWAEDAGALNTLIVWDGMLDVEQYYDMLQYLVGRGRKAVIVGSYYHIEETGRRASRDLVSAPAQLSPSEVDRFPEFLDRFDPQLKELYAKKIHKDDATFLAWLYRLLPASRGGLRTNLVKEVLDTEQKMALATSEMTPAPGFSFAFALWEAGLIVPEQYLSLEAETVAGDQFTQPQELVGLVMVPGRFGLRIPIELLLRALGREWVQNLVEVLSRFDIFRWHEDSNGQIFLGPRQTLEAQLIVQARLGGSGAEVAFARKLLLEVSDDGMADNPQVQFAVDLVRNMGPNGQYSKYFEPQLMDLSGTLTELRTQRGVCNPRLMLQEASLIREFVRSQSMGDHPPADASELLDRAEAILRDALELTQKTKRSAKLRSIILVELGTTQATKTYHYLDDSRPHALSLQYFEAARRSLFEARVLSPDDYHPIDVLAWLTERLLSSEVLDLQSEAEVKADILHIFSLADPDDFDPVQRERFLERRMQIGKLLDRKVMEEQAFNALAEQGSRAGYYLRALQMAQDMRADQELSPSQQARYGRAVAYLEENRHQIADDSRCLNLLLRLWWMAKTGKPILFKERQTVAFSQEDWRYALQLVVELLHSEGQYPVALVKFLEGLATFHLGWISNALARFRELEQEVDYMYGRKRIIHSYLASTPDGRPAVFRGTVDWVDQEKNRGLIYVEELRCKIRILPWEFPRGRELRKGEPVGRLHIAFNFIGPKADPISHLKGHEVENA